MAGCAMKARGQIFSSVTSTPFLIRLVVAFVFVFAGVAKALDPAGFSSEIDNYRVVPFAFIAPISLYLPWLEIFVGVSLFVPLLRAGAAFLSFLLTLLFSAILISAWMRHLDVSCGCFGHAVVTTVRVAAIRDMVLLIAAGYVFYFEMTDPIVVPTEHAE